MNAQAPIFAFEPGRELFDLRKVLIPIVGSSTVFPVRRIYCIGRNYVAHALERGADPAREPPFFFQKPTDAIQVAYPGLTIDHPYPPLTSDYQHEVEPVVALHRGGRNLSVNDAMDCVFGYAVGLDMTRRDLQDDMRASKRPWELGKSFDHSAVVGCLHPATSVGPMDRGSIWLQINGAERQRSDLSKMIWGVAEQLSRLSAASELFAGDIVYSGTPENVGPVSRGDRLSAHVDGLHDIELKVV